MGNIECGLSDLLIVGASLPEKIFLKSFKKYLFFDADISSSDAMVSAALDAVDICFRGDVKAEVFASLDQRMVAHIDGLADWASGMSRAGRVIRDAGDAGGLTVLGVGGKWIVHQSRPVDVGVMAIDCHLDFRKNQSLVDSFFDCSDVSDWLLMKTSRDMDLVNAFGESFLTELLRNYS